jgi:lipoate-protein ligase B
VSELWACHLGPLPYAEAPGLQDALVARRAAHELPDLVLFPDHPPVLTVGRSPSEGGVRADPATLRRLGLQLFEVPRGGDVTWHGPGQLVGYVICDLTARGRDLHRFLRDLEEALIRTASGLGIEAGRRPGRTGIWVGERKLASIGVAVRRWVSYHGFALNVCPDLGWFDLIHPCGLRDIQMTSVRALLGPRAPGLEDVRRRSASALAAVRGYDGVRWVGREELLAGTPGAAGATAPTE